MAMTIDEVREARDALEENIFDLIVAFETTAGVGVAELEMSSVETTTYADAVKRHRVTSVRVILEPL